jgi:acyl-CoA synthetase (AMP-forming)/AMP-acid ligase II
MKDNNISADAMAKVRAAVIALPTVTDVAVSRWREPVRSPGRHLADVITTAAITQTESEPPGSAAQLPVERSDREPSLLDGGRLDLPPDYPRTLSQALSNAAVRAPNRGITFLSADGTSDYVSYPQLLDEAERALAGLREAGLHPGDSVIFQFEANRAFVTAYWGCILGGFLPTPLAVPPDYQQGAGKLFNTWKLLDQAVIVTDQPVEVFSQLCGESVRVHALVELIRGERDSDWFPAQPDSPVLNLLTSGSTGVPKCVRHHNRSLVNRTWADTVVNRLTEAEVTLNSMAMDHVMGSVMSHTRDVFLTCSQVNVRTEVFIGRPLNWLDWTQRYRITNLSAPNFAFALLAGYSDQIAVGHWDLSSLRLIYNAGEPIVSRTVHQFLTLLAPHGLPADAVVPAWGMSETSSAVTHARLSRDDKSMGVVVIDQDSMSGALRAARPQTARTVTFTSVGSPIPGIRLRLVDANGALVPRGTVGRLEIIGDTMMVGYFHNDAANAEAYTDDGWFRTGDLAFVWDNGIVIAGRERDLIIVNGANYLCHEIEAVVAQVPGVVGTSTAAAGLFAPEIGTDRLIVFYVPEIDQPAEDLRRTAATVRAIRAAVAGRIGLAPAAVVPLTADEFPRTESGKIQRGQLLSSYTEGKFDTRLRQLAVLDDGPDILPSWFFAPVWEESAADPVGDDGGVVVLFADELPAGDTDRFVLVRPTDSATRVDDRGYWLNPEDDEGYATVLAAIGPVRAVVHAWTLTSAGELPTDLRRGPLAIARLVRTLKNHVDLMVVTHLPDNGGAVANGALVGLVRTIATERPSAMTRLIDVAAGDWSADLIAAEITRPHEVLVRHKDGQRFVHRLVPTAIPTEVAFETGGCYVITGGLGGLGRKIADFLVNATDARVLLVGRSESPPAESEKVSYAQVDVTDATALAAAVGQAEKSWDQPATGMLHLAGQALGDRLDDLETHVVARESIAEFDRMFAAKVTGTVAVGQLLEQRPDAWMVMFSSVNGHFGGAGFGAYAAASSFQDGFADWATARGHAVQTLGWSHWSGVGMNAGGPASAAATARGFMPITPAQGIGSLLVARATGQRRLLIGLDSANPGIAVELAAAGTINGLVVGYVGAERHLDTVRHAVADIVGDQVPIRVAAVDTLPYTPDGDLDVAALARIARRDADGSPADPPAAGLEADIARVFCEVLGRGSIGRDQSFFEVGGNSMLTMRVQGLLAERLERSLPLRSLYQNPTARRLAAALES